jgi:hypothetical protein
MTTGSIDTASRIGSSRIGSLMPWLSRIVMVPPTLIMILIGVRYIRNPIHAASPTGVALSTPEALTDTRVVGALALTVAFVIATSILSLRRLRMGHVTVIALMAFILAVRMFGFAEDGTTFAMSDQKVKTIGEMAFLTLNTLGFVLQTYLREQTVVGQ